MGALPSRSLWRRRAYSSPRRFHEPPHSDPATSADSQSATGMPVRKRALRAVCAHTRGVFATRCHVARPAADTTVTSLERCAPRTRPCCSRRWRPFCRVFRRFPVSRRSDSLATRPFVAGFLAGHAQLELRGSLACAQHRVLSLGSLFGRPVRLSCPSLVTVSRGGVARLVQTDSGGERHVSNVTTAFNRTMLIG
jgi:hypothetical protein